MKKGKIRKTKQHFKNKNNNKDKKMLKATLQEPARTSKKQNTTPIEIPQPFENIWSSCASSRGVKLLLLCFIIFVNKMLYVGSNDATKQQFTNSVQNCFDVKFLGPAQWFLQRMHSHQQKHTTHTLGQHCYVLNTLQCYNPNSKFPEHETPLAPDFAFSNNNRPVTDHDKHIIGEECKCPPFCSAVCTPLDLAYNTFAVCNLAKAYTYPGNFNFCALIWLIGFLQ
jgi:hypothetical protein